MVMKFALVFALLAVGFACPCQESEMPELEATNLSQALDMVRGFIYGAQIS
jgi:hypothetical protein